MRYVIEQLVPVDDRPEALEWVPAAYDHVLPAARAFRVIDTAKTVGEAVPEMGLTATFLSAQELADALERGSASR